MTSLIYLAWLLALVQASGKDTGNVEDFGLGIGSSAAARLVEHYAHHSLRQPRQLQIELLSGSTPPWFPPIASVESRNKILLGHLNIHFRQQHVEAEWLNVTLHSDSHIHLLPLPSFLGADTAHLTAHVPRALIRLGIVELEPSGGWAMQMDECDMGVEAMHIELERSHILNLVINPLHKLLMPRSLIHKTACDLLGNGVARMRNRFAIELPLATIVPEKFISSLLSPNISLFSQLQSISADQDQLTVTASIEWTESAEVNVASTNETTTTTQQSFPPVDTVNSTFGINPPPPAAPSADRPSSSEVPVFNSAAFGNASAGVMERTEMWVEDRVINELLARFNWQQEWIDEKIPMESPKLPQSTSVFLSTLCSNCYFVLRVRGSGVPTLNTHSNGTLVLRKGDQIHMKVVNPSRNVDAVFANFNLALGVQLSPRVESGVFRTQVDLLESDVRMEEGAFPSAWRGFIQDLVRGMIGDVIWPGLKREIESLTWSDGVAIPAKCGVKPSSVEIRFHNTRLGASAMLQLDEISWPQCVQQLRSKLPDPTKLFVLREN